MNTRKISLKTILLLAGDAVLFALAIFSAPFIRAVGIPEPGILALYRFAAPFLIVLWAAGFLMFGLYDLRAAKNDPSFYDRVIRALAFNFAVTVLLFYLIPEFRLRPLATLIIIFAVQIPLIAVWRVTANAVFGRITKDRVLFYGASEETASLARFLESNPQLGFVPVGFLAAGAIPTAVNPLLVFGANEDLGALVRKHHISIIAVANHVSRTRELVRSFFAAIPLGVTIIDFPRFYEMVEGKVPVSLINETWFLENLISARRPKYDAAKRLLDLVLALILGAIAIVLLPFVTTAIALSTPRDILAYRTRRARRGDGIVFFHQERVGKSGRPFQFVKFRSQVLGAERLGSEKGAGHDPRAYPVGTLLRKTYLDELPQLWNIAKGEMSFVGPRPERPSFVAELEQAIPFYRTRELVLPGITGWAQINMQNDASVSDAPEKIQYDLYYIKNRSLALDLTILLKTALKLLQRSGR